MLNDDADYLHEYIKISEDYLIGNTYLDEALTKLDELNVKYDGKISVRTRKTTIIGKDTSDRNGWVSSSANC